MEPASQPQQKRYDLPPLEVLQAEFKYDPETGEITRNGKNACKVRMRDLKRVIRFEGRTYLATRIAYYIHTGKHPGPHGYFEHIDGQPRNLRWDNILLKNRKEEDAKKSRRNNLSPTEEPSGYRDDAKTAPKPLPDLEVLNELFSYDPETGELRWKVGKINKHGRQREVGSIAGKPNSLGYSKVRVNKGVFGVHRIAWKMHYGTDPGRMQVDHKNMNPSDNRISNLRLASIVQNRRNTKVGKTNTSGYKGVSFVKPTGKWKAYLTYNGELVTFGEYDTAEEANEVICAAREALHGEFARHE